jgi:hypothetical protein
MNVSILHVSDLHRDCRNPIRNEPLLDSLESDRHRCVAAHDTQSIRAPDIIIVSGDVIQGIKTNSARPDDELQEQYNEALSFLNGLSDRFVNGDKERVIIVPGNHDVSAYHFFRSLSAVDLAAGTKRELVSQLFSADSPLRWSWSDFELFEITDREMYDRRLEAFSSLYATFYEGAREYPLDPTEHFEVFDYPQFNLTFIGFSSCFNNDIFNKQGAIHPNCIAKAGLALRDGRYGDRIRVAVWHHNTEGVPIQSDYMDADILQNLIDRGFSLGFHGHQHQPQFLDCRFRYGGNRRITVISAGTLCGGAAFRFGRAYNIIELDTVQLSGRLHVREMQNDNLNLPIWGPRSLPPNTQSYLSFKYDPPPEPLVRVDRNTSAMLEAESLHGEGRYAEAATILEGLAANDKLARRLLLECHVAAGNHNEIIKTFDSPESASEIISLMDALWSEGPRDRLRELLVEDVVTNSTDPSVVEMREKYEKRLSR